MSTLKVSRTQFGNNATATYNFTMTAEAGDGTMKLARGNAGGTTADIFTVGTTNAVTFAGQALALNGTLTDGATIDWNGNTNGQVVKVTLAGNRTLNAPTNIIENAMYVLRVIQDATGGRTLAWNAAFKFAYGTDPTVSTGANAVDVFTFMGGASNVLYCIGQAQELA